MRGIIFLFVVLLMLFPGLSTITEGRETPDIIVEKSRIVIEEMMLEEYKHLPRDLIKKCAGLAIIPGMVKGGFVVGGSYGKGVVLAHKEGKWTGPNFIYIAAGSLGFQIGFQSVDLILVVMGEETMRSFLKSKFKLGGEVALAAGPVGAQASAATDILLKGGIYSYSLAKGVFVGISLEGAGIGTLYELNKAYYGKPVKTKEILEGKVDIPQTGRELIDMITKLK